MKYIELTGKTETELSDMAYSLKKSLYTLNMQKKFQQLSGTSQIRKNRKDLARVLMKLASTKNK